jgi:hypothetical protein
MFLYDERADRLYVDPTDLRVALDGAADPEQRVACPSCKQRRWTFEDVPAAEIDDVLAGPWSFCFWQAPRTSSRERTRSIVRLAVGALVLVGAAALVFNPDPLGSPTGAKKGMHEVPR